MKMEEERKKGARKRKKDVLTSVIFINLSGMSI